MTNAPSERRHRVVSFHPTDLIGPTEAAKYLRVARKTAYHWLHQGYFPHHRMGKLLKIRVADLDAFLARTRVNDPTVFEQRSMV